MNNRKTICPPGPASSVSTKDLEGDRNHEDKMSPTDEDSNTVVVYQIAVNLGFLERADLKK